jgi:hypothetical protein
LDDPFAAFWEWARPRTRKLSAIFDVWALADVAFTVHAFGAMTLAAQRGAF